MTLIEFLGIPEFYYFYTLSAAPTGYYNEPSNYLVVEIHTCILCVYVCLDIEFYKLEYFFCLT